MDEYIIRQATKSDIPFLVDTIIEAEKSGTDILSYTTIFGLSEGESRKYISEMLSEEIDGCELSISSFVLAEIDKQVVAAIACWIESVNGIPSHVLKGNLLFHILPSDCTIRAAHRKYLLHELHIEYIPEEIALGLVFVTSAYRGQGLVGSLINFRVNQLLEINPNLSSIYVQVFGNNIPAIKAYERVGFQVIMVKASENKEILHFLPSNRKLLLKRELNY
jgi:ribosomal protein S18 acetylase RimI-like enzyme